MREARLPCSGDTRMPARLALGSHEFDQRLPQMVAPMRDYQVNWGNQKKYHPELYQVPLAKLRAEAERLHTLANQGSKYAVSNLRTVQAVLDERVVSEERAWNRRHDDNGRGDVHFHNNVTNAAPQSSSISTAAALGLGAGVAALVFLAFSGVAILAIFGLFAALLILAILGVASLLHRRDSRNLSRHTEHKAPQFAVADTLQPLAVVPTQQAITAETQDIRRLEHKPVRAITAQKTMEATPLVRKSSAVSTVRRTSKAVKVCR
jgi:hypothetical protein